MTETIISPFEGYKELNSPDRAEFDLIKERLIIHSDAVVVRAKNGDVISRYKDDTWDLTHYGAISSLHFDKFHSNKESVKRINYALMMFGSRKEGTNVIGGYLYQIGAELSHLHTFAEKIPLSLKSTLNDPQLLKDFCRSRPDSQASFIISLFRVLEELGVYIGITINKDAERDALLKEKYETACENKKQKPIIPVEILTNSYNQRWEHFVRIERKINYLAKFIVRYTNNPYFGRNVVDQRQDRPDKSRLVPFKNAVKKYELTGLFKHYSIKDFSTLMSFIVRLSTSCAHLIAASTGMRADELRLLRQGCFKEANIDRPNIIIGWEKKGNRGIAKPQDWVTHNDIQRVVEVLEKLGTAMTNGINLSEPDEIPLLIHINAFKRHEMRERELIHNAEIKSALSTSTRELPLDQNRLILTQDTMDNFLKKIDRPGRWENDKYVKVGQPWHFTFHQYRRTFAFLAINSGLVSFAALQRQLAHTMISITTYYSNGAPNIEPIITDGNNHITKEIEKERKYQMAIALTYNVLTSKNDLQAELSKWAEKMLDKDASDPGTFILESIKETEKQMDKGMHAKSTAVGYCMSNERCDSYLTLTFIDCEECEKTQLVEKKIDESIEISESFILELARDGYDQNSIEMRTQIREKKYFLRMKAKAQEQKNEIRK